MNSTLFHEQVANQEIFEGHSLGYLFDTMKQAKEAIKKAILEVSLGRVTSSTFVNGAHIPQGKHEKEFPKWQKAIREMDADLVTRLLAATEAVPPLPDLSSACANIVGPDYQPPPLTTSDPEEISRMDALLDENSFESALSYAGDGILTPKFLCKIISLRRAYVANSKRHIQALIDGDPTFVDGNIELRAQHRTNGPRYMEITTQNIR